MTRISSPKLLTAFGATLLVGVSAAVAGGAWHQRDGGQSPGMASVELAFANAALVLQTMTVPPGASVNHAATAADLSTMQTNGMAALSKYFSSSLAQQESSGLTNAVAALADPNFRVLGAGVSTVSYDHVQLSGNTATVAAHVTDWSRMAQMQGTKAVVVRPSGVLIVKSTLTRVSARSPWIVTTLDWTFAPGSTP